MLGLVGYAFGIYVALTFLAWLDREHEPAGGRCFASAAPFCRSPSPSAVKN
jgi:hypothetical protein